MCGRFALKWIRPDFDSTDNKQPRPLMLSLLLGLFCRHYLNRSSVLHDLRNLDDCYVDLEYIIHKVITEKCCGSLYAVTFTLMLIPWQINVGQSSLQLIYLGSYMLMNSQQQHYTCHISISLFIHQPQLSLLNSNQPFLFNLQYSEYSATSASSGLPPKNKNIFTPSPFPTYFIGDYGRRT